MVPTPVRLLCGTRVLVVLVVRSRLGVQRVVVLEELLVGDAVVPTPVRLLCGERVRVVLVVLVVPRVFVDAVVPTPVRLLCGTRVRVVLVDCPSVVLDD